jgi:hypothetical protein
MRQADVMPMPDRTFSRRACRPVEPCHLQKEGPGAVHCDHYSNPASPPNFARVTFLDNAACRFYPDTGVLESAYADGRRCSTFCTRSEVWMLGAVLFEPMGTEIGRPDRQCSEIRPWLPELLVSPGLDLQLVVRRSWHFRVVVGRR